MLELSLVHFTTKDWIFAYFSFLGEGKLILAGLSIRRCRWHRQKIYRWCRWHRWTEQILGLLVISHRYQRHRGKMLSPVSTTPPITSEVWALVLAASGASDQDVWGVYGCRFSWRFQWHHRRPWPTSGARDIADLSPQLSPILAAPHLHGVLVLVTGDKFITGVVVTADNWSPVATINLSPVSTTPAITENLWQGLITGVNDTGDTFFAGVVDTAEQLFAGVVDTSDKH